MKSNIAKKLITEALFVLLENKSLDEITVTALSRKAGVARASFYRNFRDIDEVIDYFIKQMFLDITEECSMADSSLERFIHMIFQNTTEYERELELLYRNQKLDHVTDYLYRFTYDEIQRLHTLENIYMVYYFAGAASSFYTGWIQNRFRESPEKMTEIFLHCVRGEYTPVYLNQKKVKGES